MPKNYLVILALLVIPFCNYGQTITGQVKNQYGEKISSASVTIKDSATAFSVNEFVIARNGVFKIELKKLYKRLVVEVFANQYYSSVFSIDDVQKEKLYVHDFTLTRDSIVKLQDVVIRSKQLPVQVKGDTVKYNVASYRDGTERKIQDVIKKLPGIEVNEKTGEIKYKGKSVETVKLDGDDLFASNYMIGTKNINVGVVEQVQAIEHYNENPLLKGLDNGDKVALNLTLKKMKTDYSGSAEIGFGLKGNGSLSADVSTDLLGIAKKIKSYSTLSYNNVGVNNSPFDYFSYNPNIDQLREAMYLAKKLIGEYYFDLDLEEDRTNNNNSTFGSYNAVLKFHPKLTSKINVYCLKDRLLSQRSEFTRIKANGEEILTSDISRSKKNPEQIRSDIELKWNTSTTSLLEYKFRIRNESISTMSNILQNYSKGFSTRLHSKDKLLKQSLLFTKRLTDKKAMQITFNQSFNDVPQTYSLNPAENDPDIYTENYQHSHFRKSVADIQAAILGNTKSAKYSYLIGANTDQIRFASDLLGVTARGNYFIDSFRNSTIYRKYNFYQAANINLNYRGWRLTPSYIATYILQNLQNNLSKSQHEVKRFVVEPGFSAAIRLNRFSGILGGVNYSSKPFSEEYLYDAPVYTSSRFSIKNVVNLKVQHAFFYSINYYYSDFSRLFQLNLGSNYRQNKGNYFSQLQINRFTTTTSFFYLPDANSGFGGNMLVEKYSSSLQGTVRLKSNYSLSRYKNIVNSSGLRENSVQMLSSEVFFKTAYDRHINFENIITLKMIKAHNDITDYLNTCFKNMLKIIYKPAQNLLGWVSADFFVPNMKLKKENYLFLDAVVKFSPNSKQTSFLLRAKNILNKKIFQVYDINDYSTSALSATILPRYLMLSVSRNF